MSPKMIKLFVIDAQFINAFNFAKVLFFKNSDIFRHLKLEFASAIPASNDEKYLQIIQQHKGELLQFILIST